MKFILILIFVLAISFPAAAENYVVDQYVIGAGGGQSQSANFAVIGTIGQPITGHSSSSNYSVDGGFWSGAMAGPLCEYVIGDANNSGSWTGQDVTYSVRFFKGGPTPPYSCECPAGHIWYVAGDVNGSCSFTGQDITYMVRHFKLNVAAVPCIDCPPSGSLLLRPKVLPLSEKLSGNTGK